MTASWCRLVVGALALVGWMVSDGGSRLSAPAGFPSAIPPLPDDAALPEPAAALATASGERLLEALARRLVRASDDEQTALRLARQGGRTGRLEWVEAFLTAARRRISSAALELGSAEVHYLRGETDAGLADATRATKMRPDSREAVLSVAAGRVARGEVLAALGLVELDRETREVDQTGLESRQREAQLMAVFEGPTPSPGPSWRTWVDWRRQGDPSGQARALLLLAGLDRVAGRMGPARRAAARALRLSLAAGDPRTTAMALGQSAELLPGDRGAPSRQAAACQVLREAGREVQLDCLLGVLASAWREGAVAYALRLHDRLAPAVAGNPILELRLAEPGIALLRSSGRLHDAELLATTAAGAAAALLQPSVRAHYLTRVAILRRVQGRLDDAGAALDAAVDAAPDVAGDLRVLVDLERFELASARGRAGEARAHLASAAASSTGVDRGLRSLVELQALRLEPGMTTVEGRTDPAAQPPLHEPGPEALVILARRALRLESRGNDAAAVGAYLEALRNLRDWTASMQDPLLAALVRETWRMLSRRAVDLALETGNVLDAMEALELGRWRPAMREVVASRALEHVTAPPRETWHRSVSSVPGGSAVLVYAFGARHAWGVVFRDRSAFPFRIAPGIDALRRRIGVWRQAVLSEQPGLAARSGRWLADALLIPADRAGWLDDVDRLHVIPDDALHGLSFAALPDAAGSVWGDRLVWSRSPSLESWARTLRMPARVGPTVAFGPSGGVDTRAELSEAAAGAADVAYVAGRATETRWRRAARSAGVLHFAGHAAAPDPGLRGGMLSLRADGLADGRLLLGEILGLEVDGSTVVLLGCETVLRPGARSGVGPAPELPSLSEAFLAAGARAVVGSLWQVREDVARELAVAFYRAGGPAAGPEAVAEASRQLRQKWPERPARWAAPVWVGAARPVPDATSRSPGASNGSAGPRER